MWHAIARARERALLRVRVHVRVHVRVLLHDVLLLQSRICACACACACACTCTCLRMLRDELLLSLGAASFQKSSRTCDGGGHQQCLAPPQLCLSFATPPPMLQCVAVRCSVLQCVLQCVAVWAAVSSASLHLGFVYLLPLLHLCCSVLQCVAVCCSVSQCVAVCCSVLQCVAVCCSVHTSALSIFCLSYTYFTVCCKCVLQCVAVCCSVLQWIHLSLVSLLPLLHFCCSVCCK